MFVLAFMLAQAAPFDIKGDYAAMIRTHCAGEWPDNFQMQEYCAKGQVEGMGQVRDASISVGRPLDKALEKCVSEWTKDRIPNWQMIGYCSKNQAESYRKLNP